MIKLKKIHHIAIICSNYKKSKAFYTDILGFKLESEIYRRKRKSWKADLSLNGQYTIELFSFPNPPQRITQPEALGLRHIAFEVQNIDECVEYLLSKYVDVESIRMDELTNKKFTFILDPDFLPIELYEI